MIESTQGIMRYPLSAFKGVPKYTTGEIAKICGITVRTVQYYDKRGILSPSEISEGGRRIYADEDLERMKIICFLREMDFSIDDISRILKEEHPEKFVSLMIEQQEKILIAEISGKQEKLRKLRELKKGLNGDETFSLESIGDIALIMEDKKKLRKMRWMMILTGIPLTAYQWFSIILWITEGVWWPFIVWIIAAIPWGIFISRYYFNHTPSSRKFTCPSCGYKGFCVEVWGGDDADDRE